MFADRVAETSGSAISDILKLTLKEGMISFAGGFPAAELFPVSALASSAEKVIAKYGQAALQYSAVSGIAPLREKIVQRITTTDGYKHPPEHAVITHGSQQGLDLLSKIMINPGDVVLTEKPSYPGALQAFRFYQARIITIPGDESGADIAALDKSVQEHNPKLFYLMSNYQNPTGNTYSLQRRYALVEIAKKRGLLLVEDDPYSDLIFEGERLPSLLSIAKGEGVVKLGSFSKTIVPGLRVAFAVGPGEVIDRMCFAKQSDDVHTSTFSQYLVNEYLENGNYRDHVARIVNTYRDRRNAMLGAMEREFPKSARWNRPRGGMFLWVTLSNGLNSAEILKTCIQNDVAFVPGSAFFINGEGANTMRFNFSNVPVDAINEGIRRIGRILHSRQVQCELRS